MSFVAIVLCDAQAKRNKKKTINKSNKSNNRIRPLKVLDLFIKALIIFFYLDYLCPSRIIYSCWLLSQSRLGSNNIIVRR